MKSMLKRIVTLFQPRRPLKVGWFLLGDANTGSSRIHGLNIHNYLLSRGIESVILQSSPRMVNRLTLSREEQDQILQSGFDVLIFQKVRDEQAQAFAREARRRGIRTIFLHCDCIDTDMVTAVDDLVVISRNLRDYYQQRYGVDSTIIADAIEVDPAKEKEHSDKRTITLVWVGYSDNWASVQLIRDVVGRLDDNRFRLKTISNHPDADVPWALDTVTEEILEGDVGVIPANLDAWGMGKSSNRLTMFMALGMPVVASPVPSYLDIIEQGINGYIAQAPEEWADALEALDSAESRRCIGSRARTDVYRRFSIEHIGQQWIDFLYREHRKERACPR